MSMPLNFNIGDTRPCRINSEPRSLTWVPGKLIIDGQDHREILSIGESDELRTFYCSDKVG